MTQATLVIRQSFRFRLLEEEEGFRVGRWVLLVLTGRGGCPNAEVGARWMDTDGSLEHVISAPAFDLE